MNGTNILLLVSAVAVAFFWAGYGVRSRSTNPKIAWWEGVSFLGALYSHILLLLMLGFAIYSGIKLNLPLK